VSKTTKRCYRLLMYQKLIFKKSRLTLNFKEDFGRLSRPTKLEKLTKKSLLCFSARYVKVRYRLTGKLRTLIWTVQFDFEVMLHSYFLYSSKASVRYFIDFYFLCLFFGISADNGIKAKITTM
jgi:hypothetical protein